jgi:hypothetical protein
MAVMQLSVRNLCFPAPIFSYAHSISLPTPPQPTAGFLTDLCREFTFPDGKAGQPLWTPVVEHLPEEISGINPAQVIPGELNSRKK